jgi:hypothetical protein
LNLRDLHLNGKTGKGVIVAIIDSGLRGTRNVSAGFPALDLDGSIVGCENFVDEDNDGLLDGACSDPDNDPHGTFIAGMISANAEVNIAGSSVLPAIQTHLPQALKGTSVLPMIGSAPLSSIYAFRVFGKNALAGAPQSRIIAAIDRVIRLRRRGLEIKVCNLSLGTDIGARYRSIGSRRRCTFEKRHLTGGCRRQRWTGISDCLQPSQLAEFAQCCGGEP